MTARSTTLCRCALARLRAALAGESGAMTVMAAFIIAVLLAVVIAVLLVARAVAAAHTARAAADLAALAAAQVLRSGADPCARAGAIASANGARVAICRIDDEDVIIRAEVAVDLGILGVGPAAAIARAGPE